MSENSPQVACDHYSALGFDVTKRDEVTLDQIRSAYKRLGFSAHPDKCGFPDGTPENNAAQEKFKKLAEAHQTLNDPDKRKAYDLDLLVGDASEIKSLKGIINYLKKHVSSSYSKLKGIRSIIAKLLGGILFVLFLPISTIFFSILLSKIIIEASIESKELNESTVPPTRARKLLNLLLSPKELIKGALFVAGISLLVLLTPLAAFLGSVIVLASLPKLIFQALTVVVEVKVSQVANMLSRFVDKVVGKNFTSSFNKNLSLVVFKDSTTQTFQQLFGEEAARFAHPQTAPSPANDPAIATPAESEEPAPAPAEPINAPSKRAQHQPR